MHTCWYWWWCRRCRRRLFSGVMFPFSFLSRFAIERKWMIEPEHFASQPTDIFNIPVWSINIDTLDAYFQCHFHFHTFIGFFRVPFSLCLFFSSFLFFVFKHGTGRKKFTHNDKDENLSMCRMCVCVCLYRLCSSGCQFAHQSFNDVQCMCECECLAHV